MIHVLCSVCYFLAVKQSKKSNFYAFIILFLSIVTHLSASYIFLIFAYFLYVLPFILKVFVSLFLNLKIYCLAKLSCKYLQISGEDIRRKLFLLDWIINLERNETPNLLWNDKDEYLLLKVILEQQSTLFNYQDFVLNEEDSFSNK